VARIRLPGGYVTGPRWRALAALARDFGDGRLDLTSRGNVQLRGLREADADDLARCAAAAGLLPSAAHDRARNITASPLAGLDGRPPLRPLVRALDAVLLRDEDFAALPGRFLFSLDDGTGGAGLAACDVGLLRAGNDLELVVAGRLTGVRAGRQPGEAVVAAAARAAIAAGVGRAVSRVADLPDGGASVAAAVGGALGAPAAGPDSRLPLGPAGPVEAVGAGPGNPETSSLTMVAGARLGRLTFGQAMLIADLLRPGEVIRLGLAGRIVLPLAARPATVLAAGDAPTVADSALAADAALAAADEPAGGDGALAAVEEAPAADWVPAAAEVSAAAEVPVATAAAPAADHAPAASQPAGLAGVRARSAEVCARLAEAGLLVAGDDPLAGVTACSGMACHRSVADVRAAAGPLPGHARTHWAGCARQCGLPPDAEPVVAVDADHYLIPGEVRPRLLATLAGAP
jgi:precorrin-3B synthase